jgi:hypothetical protein
MHQPDKKAPELYLLHGVSQEKKIFEYGDGES